jgi:two-component system nitrate/nitrite response regulator NarL
MRTPIKVLVVDDHTIVRSGIRHVLESEQDFVVVGEAASGTEALSLATRLQPDLSGLEVAARLRHSGSIRVLILSMHDNAEYVLESVRAGAHGYLLKDTAATELRRAIRTVCQGESYFSSPVASRLTAAVRGEHDARAQRTTLEQLTSREREVLVGIARGWTNKEIAAELGISHRTVETHRESLMRKLQIRTVAELTRFAIGAGIVPT